MDDDDDLGPDGDGWPGPEDLGPDARPSDYPEAGDWIDTDPSALGDDPCCSLIGAPQQLDYETLAGGVPDLAYNGSGWGVLWGDSAGGLVFRSLDPMANPLTPPISVYDRSFAFVAIESAGGRYAVVSSSRQGPGGVFGTVDDTGAVLSGMSDIGGEVDHPDVARYAHGGGWVEVHRVEADQGTSYEARWIGDDAVIGDPVRIETTPDSGGGAARVVGLSSIASFVWAADDAVSSRSVSWPDTATAAPSFRVFEMSTSEDTILGAAAYRDTVAVAGIDEQLHFALLDPWTSEVVAEPTILADRASYDAGGPGVAPVDERGFLGVCYATPTAPSGGESGGTAGLSFVLVGPDAEPWGEPISVTAGQRNIGGCAAAWSGSEFLVVWSTAGGDAAFNSIFAQKIEPRF